MYIYYLKCIYLHIRLILLLYFFAIRESINATNVLNGGLNRHFWKHIVYKIYTKYQTTAFLIIKGSKKKKVRKKSTTKERKLFCYYCCCVLVVKNTIPGTIILPIF